MLTSHDLAVIQAALLFANEELTPHGMDAWRPYCDHVLQRTPVSEEVHELRDRLSHCELRYGGCRPDGTVVGRLLDSDVAAASRRDLLPLVAFVFSEETD